MAEPEIKLVEYQGEKITRAERNIRWIEANCFIPDESVSGAAGRPSVVEEFQRDIIKDIYDNPYGTRKAIISMGRKNGKTVLTSWLLLLHLMGPEAKRNSQLYSSAQSSKQSRLIFDYAVKCIYFSPTLRPFAKINNTITQISCPEIGTVFQALANKAENLYGLNPSFIVHDELGETRGPKHPVFDALESATGVQAEPLSIIISTQAAKDTDLLSIEIDNAKNFQDKKTVLKVYSAPADADPFSEEAIRAANPAYDFFMNKELLLDDAEKARRSPDLEATFRRYKLNQRVSASNPFISRELWESNKDKPEPWEGKKLYCGLDLSGGRDLTAFVMVYQGDEDNRWNVWPIFWLPEETLEERSREDKEAYTAWAKKGLLETTPGKKIKYDWVAKRIYEISEKADIEKIAFDKWRFDQIETELQRAGMPKKFFDEVFIAHAQGHRGMDGPLNILEDLLLDSQIKHGGHPVLTMCMANAVAKQNAGGAKMLDKVASTNRIDGAVALTMACSTLVLPEKKKKSYLESEPLLIL